MTQRITRRDVLKGAGALAAAAAAQTIHVPALVADVRSSGGLNVAAIGCGGRGLYRQGLHPQLNYVALAEPDQGNLSGALKALTDGAEKENIKGFDAGRIKTFNDYRPMFDQMADKIDLLLIATPDHQHACPTMIAIELGKHVYCEKPLVHHISEARALGEAARGSKVVTQMGNQGSGTGGHQTLAEWIDAGAIGKVKEAYAWHVFASRFGGSMPKPEPQPVPEGFDWDAWLGPAPARPFNSVYRPWHGWCDFGTGSLGGWGPHMMDAVYYGLHLGHPRRVELIAVDDTSEDRFPRHSTVRYDFPRPGQQPPVPVFWYEGSVPNSDGSYKDASGQPTKTRPHHPPVMAEIARMDRRLAQRVNGAGSVIVGEKGMICCASHGGAPVLLPRSRREEFTLPEKKLPRPEGGIMGDFLRACFAGGGATFSGFGTFSGPFMEALLTGHLAMRAGLNNPVEWDGVQMKCTNLPDLNRFVHRDYRSGWRQVG